MNLLKKLFGKRDGSLAQDYENRLSKIRQKGGEIDLRDLLLVAAFSTSLPVLAISRAVGRQNQPSVEGTLGAGLRSDVLLFEATAWFLADVAAFTTSSAFLDQRKRKAVNEIMGVVVGEISETCSKAIPDNRDLLLERMWEWPLAERIPWHATHEPLAADWLHAAWLSSGADGRPASSQAIHALLAERHRSGYRLGHADAALRDAITFYGNQAHFPGIAETKDMISAGSYPLLGTVRNRAFHCGARV